jgi:prepilin-type N-terminal cleavage/methylation domain-containing protein
MDHRGFSLLELLIALAASVVVLLGASAFQISALRFSHQSSAQASLQHQGAMALEEMGRQIRSATALTRGTCNADSSSIQATNSSGVYCFYRSGTQLLETRTGGTFDLLSGSLAPLTVTSFTSVLSGTTRVTITFQLQDDQQNSLKVSTDISRRN